MTLDEVIREANFDGVLMVVTIGTPVLLVLLLSALFKRAALQIGRSARRGGRAPLRARAGLGSRRRVPDDLRNPHRTELRSTHGAGGMRTAARQYLANSSVAS